MADAMRAAFCFGNAARFARRGDADPAMIEIFFVYQLARHPIQAMARRWWCRSLFRTRRGRRHCPECT